MSRSLLLIDRDGTLIEEPVDEQVDTLSKVRFMPGVFAALNELASHGYQLVMVTNQDGLGSERYPYDAFKDVQEFVLAAFCSQGIRFDATFLCTHEANRGCGCRKPKVGRLVDAYLKEQDIDQKRSAVIGDRETDRQFAANLGLRALTVRRNGTPEQTWPSVVQALLARQAVVSRETHETRIQVRVNLDASEPVAAHTGIGFFDHMLEALAKHGGFSLQLSCQGDLDVDEHHTIEDCALVLGEAMGRALGDKRGIGRYGFVLPMDEAQADVAIDLSGRPFSLFSGRFSRHVVGSFPTELVPHFFRSLGDSLGATVHVSVKGENTHHMVEACFKGVGRALRQAFRREGTELPSTKGVL